MNDSTLVSDTGNTLDTLRIWLVEHAASFALTLFSAILIWVAGRWLINFVVRLVQRSLIRQKFDPTVLRYVGSFITVTLNIILVIAILSYCGIETTSFAAMLAAVALAISMAWSGLLANLAAGGFIIVLRPFKVGDLVKAGDVTGTVVEIGLFSTSLNTADNVLALVGNNKVFSETVYNYSSNPFRRVEWTAPLPANIETQALVKQVTMKVSQLPRVMPEPHAVANILNNDDGTFSLVVHAYCDNDYYDAVQASGNGVLEALLNDSGQGNPATA
ncbi:mechanosensitive ion channel family protein [Pseudomonas putida]